MVGTCDVVSTDQCCGVIPCVLCIEFETSYDTYNASATFSESTWTGTLNSIAFVSYWERNIAGECEYVVTFGGYEVYRATCYEGASCRNPAGEVGATVGAQSGTLRWSVYEPRELQLIDDPDTGCRDFFCGSCRCSCECLCVVITEYGGDVIRGEICDIAYSCDPPTWAGAVGYYELSLTLGRDQYGNCIITPTVNGVEFSPVAAPGCGSMAATITTPGGDTIAVSCKQCSCEQTGGCPCCPGWPQSASGSIAWTVDAVPSDCSGGGEINPTADFGCEFIGDELGTLVMQSEGDLYIRVFCDAETGSWKVQYRSPVSGGGFENPASATWADATDVEFVCPDCADSVNGQATGTIDFIAVSACETSGGVINYNVMCHGEITIGCP